MPNAGVYGGWLRRAERVKLTGARAISLQRPLPVSDCNGRAALAFTSGAADTVGVLKLEPRSPASALIFMSMARDAKCSSSATALSAVFGDRHDHTKPVAASMEGGIL